MLLYSKSPQIRLRHAGLFLMLSLILAFSACQFRPLHGNLASPDGNVSNLSGVTVSQVNSRVGQQVRNHLLFLLNGGFAQATSTHEARIRVTWTNRQLAAIETNRDSSAGTVTVTVYYDLVEIASGKITGSGTRQASASYDRTGQVFANRRAERDAEDRAAKEAAESIRLSIAADLASA